MNFNMRAHHLSTVRYRGSLVPRPFFAGEEKTAWVYIYIICSRMRKLFRKKLNKISRDHVQLTSEKCPEEVYTLLPPAVF